MLSLYFLLPFLFDKIICWIIFFCFKTIVDLTNGLTMSKIELRNNKTFNNFFRWFLKEILIILESVKLSKNLLDIFDFWIVFFK